MDDVWLRESLSKLQEKIESLDEKMDDMKITHERNTVILDEHIRRTEIAEQNIDSLRADLKPIQTHVTQISFVFKFIGFISVIASIISASIKLIDYIK